jgi:tetratricopeptide (TPR) repeat protein
MTRRTLLPLLALVFAASSAAAQAAPPRPSLPRGADPNDWEAYFDRGAALLPSEAKEADAAFYWAQRLNPARAEPLYGRWVALHMQNVTRWEAYMRDNPAVLASPEIIRADSLLLYAQVRNPFVHRGLLVVLYQATPGNWSGDAYTRGMLDYSAAKFPQAVRTLSGYVQRYPRRLDARWSLVLALVSSNQMDSAQAVMNSLVEAMRLRDETRVVRAYQSKEMQEYAAGLLYLARHQPAQARAAMEQALVENAAAWFAHSGRALALRAERRPQEAVQEMTAALELAPEDAMLHFDRAGALIEAGHFPESAAEYRRAVAMEPFWADAWLGLGDAERVAGHAAEAVAAYERYLALAPRREASLAQVVQGHIARLRQPAAAP